MDYQASRIFYELYTNPSLAADYRQNREAVLQLYPLTESVHDAMRRDDVGFFVGRINGFLLRYYFQIAGMSDTDFIARLQDVRTQAAGAIRHG